MTDPQVDVINSTNHTNLIGIHWEISSACQAACPCCPRKDEDYGLANFVQTYTTKNQVEHILNGVDKLSYINFCGNIGDPMTNPEIVEIVKFLRNKYGNILLTIHTNGGIGNPDRYYELGKLGTKMIFGVDGTEGVNELHRVNVDFKKIDRNAREYSNGLKKLRLEKKTNHSLFHIQFIVWDQNIHDLPNVIEWAKKVDADNIRIRKTSSIKKITDIYDNDGNYLHGLTYYDERLTKFRYSNILEKTYYKDNFDELLTAWNSIENVKEIKSVKTNPTTKINLHNPNKIKFPTHAPYKIINESSIPRMVKNKQKNVNCHALYADSSNVLKTYIFINYQNIVLPCCYMGSEYARANIGTMNSLARYPDPMDATEVEFLNKLNELGIDKFNATQRPLVEILNDTILDDLAFKNMSNKNKLAFCGATCGNG